MIILALCRTMISAESALSAQTVHQMGRLRDEWTRQGRSGLALMLDRIIDHSATAVLTAVAWPHESDLDGPAALRAFARDPVEAAERFDATRLSELADSIESVARRPLFERTPPCSS